jgi:GDP-L-fucose synthase
MTGLHERGRVWVAGHRGMVGQAVCRQLAARGREILSADRNQLDLRDQAAVRTWIAAHRPEVVILAAGTVGGIEANRTRPAEFLYDNLMIAANVIAAAHEADIDRLLYLGSSCIYPRMAVQPIVEDALMTGPLEPTNRAYALAKICGIGLCDAYRAQYGRDYISAMPCNLYGPGDRFDTVSSHVIPAMVMKFHQAKMRNDPVVTIWGTGNPLREFLHVDDLARGLMVLLESYHAPGAVNIGSGVEVSIRDLAVMIARHTGYAGEILFDPAMPDGAPRKLLDCARMRGLGWVPEITLEDGLRGVIAAYRMEMENMRNAA